jgi:hypothetical protein
MQDQPSEPKSSQHPLTDAIRTALRRATPPDAPAVRDLTRAAYAKWVPVLGREPLPMTADYDAAFATTSWTCCIWTRNWPH